MAELWSLLDRARLSILPMLIYVLLALYLPRIQRIYAQNMQGVPEIDMEMDGVNIHDCVEGQTIVLYCDIRGISSAQQYEVNWTKGVRQAQSTGVTLVKLDNQRVTYSTWVHGDDSVTYTLRLENATINDSGVYTCQIFYRYKLDMWYSVSDSRDVHVRRASNPLPQCKSQSTSNIFYSGDQIRFSCLSRVDDHVTLSWMRLNIDRGQVLLPEMDIRNKDYEIHTLIFPAEEKFNGAIYVCTQYNMDRSEGNCILGPVHVLPAPTFFPTTTFTPSPTVPTTVKSTTIPTVPKLHGYDGMVGINETQPDVVRKTNICPRFSYILVPTAIAIVSVILNFYLWARLRNAKQSTVDKMCENKHCGTRYRSGTLDKEEYCTCGYMLKIAQHESEV